MIFWSLADNRYRLNCQLIYSNRECTPSGTAGSVDKEKAVDVVYFDFSKGF